MTSPVDPLDMSVRALLERVLTAPVPCAQEPEWVDIRSSRWPWRQLVAAAERGEVSVARVGRRLMMRTAELDSWLESQRIQPRARLRQEPAPAPNRVAHLLADAGYSRKSS